LTVALVSVVAAFIVSLFLTETAPRKVCAKDAVSSTAVSSTAGADPIPLDSRRDADTDARVRASPLP
jgi:hypothetical protein